MHPCPGALIKRCLLPKLNPNPNPNSNRQDAPGDLAQGRFPPFSSEQPLGSLRLTFHPTLFVGQQAVLTFKAWMSFKGS
jgi:hypothetical protein